MLRARSSGRPARASRNAVVHIRPRSDGFAAEGGVLARPRRWHGRHKKSDPAPASVAPASTTRSSARTVPVRVARTVHRTHLSRTDVRPNSSGLEDLAPRAESQSPTPIRGHVISFVRWYQSAVAGRPSPCRFTPGCSSYALEALEVHGTRRGLWLTLRRLLRCRPFGPSGFDPVPEPGPDQRKLNSDPHRHHQRKRV